MSGFGNLRISSKLLVAFSALLGLTTVLGLFALDRAPGVSGRRGFEAAA